MPAIGEMAPDFSAPTDSGSLSLSALRGKKVVLYFYPKDSTPGCTLEARGFRVVETPLTAFLKAGGAAKCLTLRLDESRPASLAPPVAAPAAPNLHRTIRLRGHLLDSGLINTVLDRIVEGGGSFQVLDFEIGRAHV